ncbi:MAG: flagellar assembly protein [Bdellovibrionaceae bacterium]|nr:flagellar assembly protein [Pseudobdellovibrionaceae bacterium]NUM59401.1 flagellar assembly protein [Pseudobdellovibrionaceae bacterium]
MPWYNRSVLKKSVADSKVMEFTPAKFDLGTPLQALEYLEERKKGSEFLMNPVIQVQTGVEQLQNDNIDNIAEDLALDKVKEIQESAYKEGYDLGFDEGLSKAYSEKMSELNYKFEQFDSLLKNISQLKKDLELQNETHLIQLIYHMVERVSLRHVEMDNGILIDVMRQALSLAQDEENVTVLVSEQQLDFIEEIKKQTSREFEFLKKINIESNNKITPGGCIVQTNYGEVDSRTEQRLEKLWDNLKESLPKVKEELKYESSES